LKLAPQLWRSSRTTRRERFDSLRREGGARGESGAVLMLALVFLIVVGGIVGVLSNSISSHLEDSTAFSSGRNLQYAATSAVDLAIQNIRYTPLISPGETLDASPPVQCWNPDPGTAFSPSDGAAQWGGVNGEPLIDLWCSTVWNPTSADTRTVTISACEDAVNGSAQECAATPLLQAVVAFDDYPQVAGAPSSGICSIYCGSGETVESWSWSPVIPTVTNLYTPQTGTSGGPITGNTTVVLSGTGFVAGTGPGGSGATTVNFIQESGGVATLTNAIPAVTPTSVTSTSLTFPSPAVTGGTTYFVTVTTPTGTSAACVAAGTCYVFTYTTNTAPSVPTVSGLSVSHETPAQGTTDGDDLITITGTGFYGAPQVNFIPEGAGTTVSATDVLVTAPSSSVPAGTQITAATPGVIAGTNYLVQVVTTAGSSSTSSVATVQYTYDLPAPIVSGIGASSVTTSSSYVAATGPLAIVGTSFFTGATVQFQPVNNTSCPSYQYGTVTDTTYTINSPTLITDPSLPSGLSSNCTYVVAVNTTAGTSSNTIDFQL
jgi:hypothetical protein